jgi:hypothetical protein
MRPILLASLLALAGCSGDPGGTEHLNEYLSRLSSATGMALPARDAMTAPVGLPRERPIETIDAQAIDLIDFLSLSGCELQINLGRRNTQLGRTASPSQQLLLHLEFLALAPPCLPVLRARGEVALADKIDSAHVTRRQHLPQLIFQAVLQGPEWQAFWQPAPVLGLYPANTDSRVITALSKQARLVERWLDGDWSAGAAEFELLLSELRAGDGGTLLFALQQAHFSLGRANQLLANLAREAPLCPYGHPTERSKALQRVVERFFVGDLQPWLTALRRRWELLNPAIEQLERPLAGALPQSYEQWRKHRDHLPESLIQEIKAHVGLIQQALASCNAAQ